tara:strand:- start:912 stop:1217 length:306 start_codon:yes stop_codon:yes gene_type:complete
MNSKNSKKDNLKVFFIKLVAITIAAIISINILFNLLISDKIKYFDTLISLTELENRRDYADKLRDNLNNLLKKDEIIKKEDKILLYKLYQKLKSEFKDIEG